MKLNNLTKGGIEEEIGNISRHTKINCCIYEIYHLSLRSEEDGDKTHQSH